MSKFKCSLHQIRESSDIRVSAAYLFYVQSDVPIGTNDGELYWRYETKIVNSNNVSIGRALVAWLHPHMSITPYVHELIVKNIMVQIGLVECELRMR